MMKNRNVKLVPICVEMRGLADELLAGPGGVLTDSVTILQMRSCARLLKRGADAIAAQKKEIRRLSKVIRDSVWELRSLAEEMDISARPGLVEIPSPDPDEGRSRHIESLSADECVIDSIDENAIETRGSS